MKFRIKKITKNKEVKVAALILVLTISISISFLLWRKIENEKEDYLIYLREAKGTHVIFTDESELNIDYNFEGVGIAFSAKSGVPIVSQVINDSPADIAGIKSGDKIMKIDGKSTSGMTEWELSEKLKGKKGSQVSLTIYRDSFGHKTENFLITRDIIVKNRVKDDEITALKQQISLINYNLVEPLSKHNQKIDHWNLYSNEKYNFEFKYPNTFLLIESDERSDNGNIIRLMVFDKNAESLYGRPNPGFFTQMSVSYWHDINDEHLKGGSWINENKYSGFQDFLSDSEHTMIHTVGNTTIDGIGAYILSMPGHGGNEAIMFEYNSGYYRIDFAEDVIESFSEVKDKILSSFVLK